MPTRRLRRRRPNTPSNRQLRRRPIRRNSKCTPVRKRIIYAGLKAGLSQKRCCQLAGVSDVQYYNWQTKGRNPDHPLEEGRQIYRMFADRIAKLKAVNEQEALDIIRAAMKGGEKIRETKIKIGEDGMEITKIIKTRGSNWQAAAWRLERMDPDSYGRKFIEHKDDQKAPEQVAQEIREALAAMDETVPEHEEAA